MTNKRRRKPNQFQCWRTGDGVTMAYGLIPQKQGTERRRKDKVTDAKKKQQQKRHDEVTNWNTGGGMNRCSQRMGVYDFKIYILICYYYRNCFVFYCSMRVFQISQITAKKICNSLCLLQWMNTITGILINDAYVCVYYHCAIRSPFLCSVVGSWTT